jgi:hypothetical protein
MGQGEARRDEVLVLARDIERLRRRGESLTSELIDRAQPGIRTIRTVVAAVQERPQLWKALLLSPLVLGGLVCVAAGALTGSFVHRVRHRRRLRGNVVGRLLLAFTDG